MFAALLAGAVYLFWTEVLFVAKLAVPGPAYSQAAERDSDPAPRAANSLPTVPAADAETAEGPPEIDLAPIAELPSPIALAQHDADSPVLLALREGQVVSLDLDDGTTEPLLDLSDRISTRVERGLLGLAIDPAGERMYLNYSNGKGDNEIRSWPLGPDGFPVGGADAGILHLTIGQPFENHNGGHLAFGPDGLLWVGTGDGGGAGDRGNVAQKPTSLLGKMLRVDPDPKGGVKAPSTNPDWDGRPEVWAVGLRNPWRYSFDRDTNRLWVADVGQGSIEEVTVADPDEPRPNFGWSVVEGNNDYRGKPSPEFLAPAVEYGHDEGCSITGGYVYRGAAVESLVGWYLYADFCQGWIKAVRADDPGDPVEVATDVGQIISFGELADGELLVLTTEQALRIT